MSRAARAPVARPPRPQPKKAQPPARISPKAVVAVLAGAYTILFLLASKGRFDTFAFRDQDLALNAQALWVLLHGSTRISVWGASFLSNHLQWATFVLAPFYALFPSALFLLFVQTFALAAGVIPLYRIAERRLGGRLAAVVSAAYLLHPALGYVNFAEFHMPSLVVPLLLWGHDAYERDRRGLLTALMVAVALVQENFPLFGAAYGVLLFVKRRDRVRGALLTAGCLLYFYLGLQVVPPLFWKSMERVPTASETVSALPPFFPGMGRTLPDLVVNFARNPVGAIAGVYEPRKGIWLAQLVLPLALLPLAGAEWLLPALPYLAQHLLSVRENETSIRSHYAAEIMPFLMIAAVVGAARIRRRLPASSGPMLLGAVLLAAAVIGCKTSGCQFYLVSDLLRAHEAPPDPVKVRVLEKIPKDASVVATFDLLPHLVNRFELHTLDHAARGSLTRRDIRFRLPVDTRYAAVDWMDDLTFRRYNDGSIDRRLANFFANGSWRVLDAEGTVTLLEKDEQAVARLAPPSVEAERADPIPRFPFSGETQLFEIAPELPGGGRARLLFDGALELLDARVVSAPTPGAPRVGMSLVWRAREPVPLPGQYTVKIELIDATGRILVSAVHPIAYNIYPPARWTPGEAVRESVWLPAPKPIPRGDYGIGLRLEAYHEPRKVPAAGLIDGVAVGEERAIAGVWRNR